MRTSCEVRMELTDVAAIGDGVLSAEKASNISDIDMLKEQKEYQKYVLIDKNNMVLDGSCRTLTDDENVPFLSDASDDKCGFTQCPAIVIEFSKKHTSAGITLYFNEYPAEVKLTWYSSNDVKIIEKSFCPDEKSFFCRQQVSGFEKIRIEFVKTRLPMQRVGLTYVKYGKGLMWNANNIKSAAVYEEIDTTSATLPINTAEVTIFDEEKEFDITNQKGMWNSLQKNQPVTIGETVEGKSVACGTFYLDEWKSQEGTVSFSLIDKIGVLEKTKFYEGRIYVEEKAKVIVAEIMESAGVEEYEISEEVGNISLTGHIGICNHREALQQVVFACGAVARCKRDGGIRIYRPDRKANRTIEPDRIFMGMKSTLQKYVSAVSITFSSYKKNDEKKEVFSDVLAKGDTLVEFTEPCAELEVTGGTIARNGTNYAVIRTDEESSCTLKAFTYEKTDHIYTAGVEKMEAGEEANVLKYSGCTLFNAIRAKEAAEHILNYHQLRQVVEIRFLLDEEQAGEWAHIRDTESGHIVTGITSQSVDLTGGFISTATCRGYNTVVIDPAFGGEFYTNERGLI